MKYIVTTIIFGIPKEHVFSSRTAAMTFVESQLDNGVRLTFKSVPVRTRGYMIDPDTFEELF